MRVVAFIVVGLAHLLALYFLMVARERLAREAVDDLRMTVVWLPPLAAVPDSDSVDGPAVVSRPRQPSQIHTPQVVPEPAKPSVDWVAEATRSATSQVDAREAQRRQSGAFTPIPDSPINMKSTPMAPSDFGWYKPSTQRVEPLEGGGVLVRLNERCVLVISGMVFPICQLDKIPVRGDLFKHMNDPPALGQGDP